MNKEAIKQEFKKVLSEISDKKRLITLYKEKLETFINQTVLPAFSMLKDTIESNSEMLCEFSSEENTANIIFYARKEAYNPDNILFEYQLKVISADCITVYASRQDPDTNAFRPKDIFGDFEKLDISNTSQKEIIHDILSRFKYSEFQIIEDQAKL